MNCSTTLKSISGGCPSNVLKQVRRLILVPPKDSAGLPHSIDNLEAFTKANIDLKINAVNQADRWYPTIRISKSTPTTADPATEESTLDILYLEDGKISFELEMWESYGADAITKSALDNMRSFNAFLIDKNGRILCYVDEDYEKIMPVPLSTLNAMMRMSDVEGTAGQKVVLNIVFESSIDYKRLVLLDRSMIDFDAVELEPLIDAGKMTSKYEVPTTTSMRVFISGDRYKTGITGLTTADVSGAIVGGIALDSLTLTPNTSLGAGWYDLAFSAIAIGSTIQLIWAKEGYIFTELNEKISPAVPTT